jgi:hypothetical protein
MKVRRRISIGGWIFLIHFSCVAIVFSLPILVPQPRASITSGEHWYWGFLDFTERLCFWLALPASCFMSHPRDAGLCLFDHAITEATFVPFCVILALNSLLIGYTAQLLVRLVRGPRAAHSTVGNDEEFKKLLDEHRKGQV